MNNSRSGVARAATAIMFMTVLTKLAGFAREQVIAGQFGATGLTDAYVTAWTVSQALFGVVGGAISMAFVPLFIEYLGKNEEKQAADLFGATFWVVGLLLCGVSAVVWLAAPLIIANMVPDFEPALQASTVTMLRVMLPGVLFAGLSLLLTALLNSLKRFAWPAAAPLLLHLGTIGGSLLLSKRLGIVGLAWATLLGTVLQATFLFWQIRRQKAKLGIRFSHPGLKPMLVLAAPILVGLLSAQVYQLVDKVLASGLDAGSITALNYAFKLTQLPVGIFVMALAAAIYPTLAEHGGKGDKGGLSRTTGSGIKLLSLVMVPAAAGLLVLRVPIVQLAFERGSFSHAATVRTSTALAFYAIGLLGVANVQILSRAFYALQDSLTPVKVSIGAALTNVLLAMILVKPLGHGGLALAYSLAMLLNMTCLIWLLSKKTGQSPDFLPSLAKITGAAAAMGLVVHFLYPRVTGLGQIVALGLAVGVGMLAYLGLVAVLGVEELRELMATVKRRLGRGRGDASGLEAN